MFNWEMVTQVIILAGGFGTRLGSITNDTPKPLLSVGGIPFLYHIINNLVRQGINEIILSVGYLADKIQDEIGDGKKFGIKIRYCVEEMPLGTGGAVKLAARNLEKPFLVLR
jgi:NDP-sugar pyrophosphorylase family protein